MPESKEKAQSFEKRVKILLLLNDMTQAELAQKVGVTRQYLNGVIRGKIESENVKCKICTLLEMEELNGD